MSFKFFFSCIVLASCFFSLEAHNRSESYSRFTFLSEDNGVSVQVVGTIKQDILNRLNPAARFISLQDFVSYLNNSIDLGQSCKLTNPVDINENLSLGMMKFFWSFECSYMPERIMIPLFQDFGITHTHIARGSVNGETIPEFMFSNNRDVWFVTTPEGQIAESNSYWGYLRSGIEHILSGWDHLTFLLGLLLLFQGTYLIIAITGFTIGHSLTLGLGAMNVLRVHTEMVEILIGFSILLLAIEKFFKHVFEFDKLFKNLIFSILALSPLAVFGTIEPVLILGLALFLTIYLSLTNHYPTKWLPLFITVFFGLIHGLGFASSIAEVGLPQDKLWQIILSFNIGVEIGQLAVALLLLGILGIFKNNFNYKVFYKIHNLMGVVVFSMGTFWFVSRAIGI